MALRCGSIAGLFLLLFLLASAWGATDSPWGTVLTAFRAQVGTVAASPGGTLFSGDILTTDEKGAIQIEAGTARLFLPSSSEATLHELDGSPAATLSYGRAVFSAAKSPAFVLLVARVQIQPRGDVFTVGQVALEAPKQFIVHCRRGALRVTFDDETRIVSEGESYRVVLDSVVGDHSHAPQVAGTKRSAPGPSGWSSPVWIPISIGGGAFGVWVIHEALESPDRP